jgi:UDP-N-acetylmuramyl pentapeptide phosphotransferase/UDP-N-acetylglucosamine-1-phosphate transferase
MNGIFLFFLLLLLFMGLEWAYLQLAKKFAIIDKPNLRSSHDRPIVRGGGIIFPIAWFVFMVVNDFAYPWMSLGLLLLCIVSFIDDIRSLSAMVGPRYAACWAQCNSMILVPSMRCNWQRRCIQEHLHR